MRTAAHSEIEANHSLRVQAKRRSPTPSANPVRDRCTGGRVLADIGCGFGGFLEQMRDRYDTLIGCDFVPLERSAFNDVNLIRSDLRQGIPLGDCIADTVTAVEVIEHVANPVLLVEEAFRITRPGGEFMVTTPNVRYMRHLIRLFVQGHGPRTSAHRQDEILWDGGHIHYFTSSDVVALFRDAGFVSIRSLAMIGARGFLPGVRRLLSRWPENPIVREFLTGRLMVTGRKPEHASS